MSLCRSRPFRVPIAMQKRRSKHFGGHMSCTEKSLLPRAASGVHGVLLKHADDPGAVGRFAEAVRFPIHHQGLGTNGLREAASLALGTDGRRGVAFRSMSIYRKRSGVASRVNVGRYLGTGSFTCLSAF